MTAPTTDATTDALAELELDFEAALAEPAAPVVPAAPAVPAYLTSAARRRAEDEARGYRAFTGLYALAIAGLVVSMGVLGIVATHVA